MFAGLPEVDSVPLSKLLNASPPPPVTGDPVERDALIGRGAAAAGDLLVDGVIGRDVAGDPAEDSIEKASGAGRRAPYAA